MKEIADQLGLSRTTVSNILNNNLEGKTYRKETIELVKNKAEEIGYIQNQLATSLKTGKSRTIALIVPDIANNFYINVIKEIERLSSNDNYNLIISLSEEDLEKESRAIETVMGKMVDGILISPVSYYSSLRNSFESADKVICFDRYVNLEHIPSVSIDNYATGKYLAEKMVAYGCKNPLFLGGNSNDITNIRRLDGLRDVFKNQGSLSTDNILFDIYTENQVYKSITKFCNRFLEFDSFFLTTSNFINGVIQYISEKELNIKCIASFEDFSGKKFIKEKVNFPFFIAQQPEELIGRIAYEKVQSLISGKPVKSKKISIEKMSFFD
jgi:LacI family transcriptional regulator